MEALVAQREPTQQVPLGGGPPAASERHQSGPTRFAADDGAGWALPARHPQGAPHDLARLCLGQGCLRQLQVRKHACTHALGMCHASLESPRRGGLVEYRPAHLYAYAGRAVSDTDVEPMWGRIRISTNLATEQQLRRGLNLTSCILADLPCDNLRASSYLISLRPSYYGSGGHPLTLNLRPAALDLRPAALDPTF